MQSNIDPTVCVLIYRLIEGCYFGTIIISGEREYSKNQMPVKTIYTILKKMMMKARLES